MGRPTLPALPGSAPSTPGSTDPPAASSASTTKALHAPAPGAGRDALFDTRGVLRRIGLFVLIAVIVAVLVATLPGVGEVRDRLRGADLRWVAAIAAASIGSVVAYIAALLGAFDRVVPWRRGVALGLAEQGANVLLPAGGTGGPAVGTFIMRRAGVPTEVAAERHVALFLITSAVGFASLTLFGLLVGLGVLPSGVPAWQGLAPAAGGALVLLGVAALARLPRGEEPSSDRRLGHGLWRVRGFLRDGVRTSLRLLAQRDPLLLGGAVLFYALDVAALGAAFQAFGDSALPIGIFVLAYTIGHAGAFLPTPGGVGGTDGGLIGMFVAYGTPLDLATAAVLSYRVFQLGLPAILGAVGLFRIRKALEHPPDPGAQAERYAALRSPG